MLLVRLMIMMHKQESYRVKQSNLMQKVKLSKDLLNPSSQVVRMSNLELMEVRIIIFWIISAESLQQVVKISCQKKVRHQLTFNLVQVLSKTLLALSVNKSSKNIFNSQEMKVHQEQTLSIAQIKFLTASKNQKSCQII